MPRIGAEGNRRCGQDRYFGRIPVFTADDAGMAAMPIA